MSGDDVALAPLQQSDGSVKNRPVILLSEMPPFGDWLVCGVSTQVRQRVAGFDELIAGSDPDFPSSGLKATSLIRLGYLAVLPASDLLGAIGAISSERYRQLLENLCRHLQS